MVTVQQIIDFIRQEPVLDKWTDLDLVVAIQKGILHSAITWIEKDNKPIAVCFGEWETKEIFYVHYMAGKGHVRTMLRYLRQVYPQCKKLKLDRKGKYNNQSKTFNLI